MTSLYLHVPFCARACDYCAFFKEKADRTKIDLYLNTIEQELEKFPPSKPVETVFFGGGTPTLLSAEDLDRLCGAVKSAVGENILEWTIECAPATLKKEKLEVLKKWGVNRFSLGVQSFNSKTLEAIGRPHSLKQVEEAINLLKENVSNWNMDLIFAAADSTLSDWMNDLEKAVSLGSPHISTYCLTFESDTELFVKMLRGQKHKPSADEEARFYKATWKFLREAGLHHYELANFARPGCECRHNLTTWRMGEWWGYGPSAASQTRGCSPPAPLTNGLLPLGTQEPPSGNYQRFTNIPDLEAWAKGVAVGKRALVDESTLTPREMAIDAIIFGLRMPDGIDVAEILERFGQKTFIPPKKTAKGNIDRKKLQALGKDLAEEKYLVIEQNRWRLTEEGLLVADRIALEVMGKL